MRVYSYSHDSGPRKCGAALTLRALRNLKLASFLLARLRQDRHENRLRTFISTAKYLGFPSMPATFFFTVAVSARSAMITPLSCKALLCTCAGTQLLNRSGFT